MQSVSGEKKIEEKKKHFEAGRGNEPHMHETGPRPSAVGREAAHFFSFFFFFSLPHLLRKMPGPRAGGGIVRVGDCSAGFFFLDTLSVYRQRSCQGGG